MPEKPVTPSAFDGAGQRPVRLWGGAKPLAPAVWAAWILLGMALIPVLQAASRAHLAKMDDDEVCDHARRSLPAAATGPHLTAAQLQFYAEYGRGGTPQELGLPASSNVWNVQAERADGAPVVTLVHKGPGLLEGDTWQMRGGQWVHVLDTCALAPGLVERTLMQLGVEPAPRAQSRD
jgi:hypothetical protein